MAKQKLALEKCKVLIGKNHLEYDLQLLGKDGNSLATISIYKENGMTEIQRKAICKKIKLALGELIANGI